jgi:uncharacterized membrane protein
LHTHGHRISVKEDHAVQRVEKSIRVKAPASKVYEFWRNFQNFPSFMHNVEDVRVVGGNDAMSHWKIKGPLGVSVEFDAQMTKDEPNKQIGWNSTGGTVETSGAVTFTELGDDTEVHVVMQYYDPPGGAVGEAASRVLQNPEAMLEEDLQRFKDIAEGRVGSGLRRSS